MNVVDYLIITTLFLSGLSGFNKGLMASVGKIVSLVAGLLVALCFCDDLALMLQRKFAFCSMLALRLQETPLSFTALDNPILQIIAGDWPGATDMRLYLAEILALILSFIFILIIVSTTVNFLWLPLTSSGHGIMGWLNRLGGLVLSITKNALIMAVIFLTVFPLLQALASTHLPLLTALSNYLGDSALLTWLNDSFNQMEQLPGRSV